MMDVGFPKQKLNPNLNESVNPYYFGFAKKVTEPDNTQDSDSNSVTFLISHP